MVVLQYPASSLLLQSIPGALAEAGMTVVQWNSIVHAVSSGSSDAQCCALGIECAVCLIFAFPCIFCCHPCISDGMIDSKTRQNLIRVNYSIFQGNAVCSFLNNTVIINTDNLPNQNYVVVTTMPQQIVSPSQYSDKQQQVPQQYISPMQSPPSAAGGFSAPISGGYSTNPGGFSTPSNHGGNMAPVSTSATYASTATAVQVQVMSPPPRTMLVIIPEGYYPGNTFLVASPEGQQFQVQVPPNFFPGQQLTVQY